MSKNVFNITVIRQYEKDKLLSGLMYLTNPQGVFMWSAISIENKLKAIPVGTYPLSIYASPKFKTDVLLFENVPKRSFIEIHIANSPHELEGCIAPNVRIDLPSRKGINSKVPFDALMLLCRQIAKETSNSITCTITDIRPQK